MWAPGFDLESGKEGIVVGKKCRIKERKKDGLLRMRLFLDMTRRSLLVLMILFSMAASIALAADTSLPVLFVHGNSDSAALWHTTLWRFESNGYDPSLLSAIDFTHPRARSDDTKPQENRSGTADQLRELSERVDEVLTKTGHKQLVLVGSSRGGYAIRNYIKNGEERKRSPMPSSAVHRIMVSGQLRRTSTMNSTAWGLSYPASTRVRRFILRYGL